MHKSEIARIILVVVCFGSVAMDSSRSVEVVQVAHLFVLLFFKALREEKCIPDSLSPWTSLALACYR